MDVPDPVASPISEASIVGLERVAEDLRTAFLCGPPSAAARRHLDAMLAVARRARARSRFKLAAGVVTGAVLVSGGVAAAEEVLPAPLQRTAAAVVSPLGINLPEGRAALEPPGLGGENPGNVGNAPGLQGDPGSTEDAPGLGGANPGAGPAHAQAGGGGKEPERPTQARPAPAQVDPGQPAKVPDPAGPSGVRPPWPVPATPLGGSPR